MSKPDYSRVTTAHINQAVRNLRGTRVPKARAFLMFAAGLALGIASGMVGIAVVKFLWGGAL